MEAEEEVVTAAVEGMTGCSGVEEGIVDRGMRVTNRLVVASMAPPPREAIVGIITRAIRAAEDAVATPEDIASRSPIFRGDARGR